MADYIIDIWKDGELVQSVAGKWTDEEAPRLTVYLGYYRADRAQLLGEPDAGGAATVIAEIGRDHDLVVIGCRCRRASGRLRVTRGAVTPPAACHPYCARIHKARPIGGPNVLLHRDGKWQPFHGL